MNWTLTNFLIEMIAGIVGGHAIAVVAKEHNFGALRHTIARCDRDNGHWLREASVAIKKLGAN
jgi:hypothetical protein